MPVDPVVVFKSPKQVIVEDRPRPAPARGELLIRTRRTLISTGTELTVLAGGYAADSAWAQYCGKFPFDPGYNNVGVVEAAGEGVDAAWVGRRVASYGPHAAWVVQAAASVHRIPDAVPDERAAFWTIAEIVMNGVRRGGVQWGEAAAVCGLGLLGQLAVRFCLHAGARPVIAVDVADARLRLLPRDPAVASVNPAQTDAAAAARTATRGRMADVVFEVTGNADLIPGQFALLRPQGRYVVLSSPRGATPNFNFHDLCNAPSFTIIGAHNSSHPPQETPATPWTKARHVELFFDLVAEGKIEVDSLVSHRATAQKAPELYAMLLKDRSRAMGVVLEWGH